MHKEENLNLIKVLATDVDGTITDKSRRGCLSAIETIHRVEDMGIPVIIVTGNILCFTSALTTFLSTSGGIVAENGGVIEVNGKPEILGDYKLCNEAYEYLRAELPVEKVQNSNLRVSEIALTRKVPVTTIKKVLEDHPVEIYDSKFAIHITDPEVNKGSSLLRVTGALGFKPEEIMAVGDSENDMEFLSAVGLKIAVSNANDELKDIADYVAKNAHGDGFKEAVERFIF
jgi:phosphoglycolate phosphatase (TIGR01487 family)